jgi:hypothetical protein
MELVGYSEFPEDFRTYTGWMKLELIIAVLKGGSYVFSDKTVKIEVDRP